METQRSIPNAVSRRPPLNIRMSVIFFRQGRCDFHTIGMGMAMRYMSVKTFITMTKMVWR